VRCCVAAAPVIIASGSSASSIFIIEHHPVCCLRARRRPATPTVGWGLVKADAAERSQRRALAFSKSMTGGRHNAAVGRRIGRDRARNH